MNLGRLLALLCVDNGLSLDLTVRLVFACESAGELTRYRKLASIMIAEEVMKCFE